MTPLFPRERLTTELGVQLTQALFFEYKNQGAMDPMYTLKEQDYKGCLSMYKIYMDSESEYEAAIKLLGSWNHWKKLCQATWFKPYIEAWREERLIREAAIGKAILIEKALEGNVSAAKELASQVKGTAKVGRPNKAQQEAEQKRLEEVDAKVYSLLERVGNG